MQKNYFWDENSVRYHLAQTNPGEKYNWLFFPGGPGADSSYLLSLINGLNLPGNVWLIDLPENGSNTQANRTAYDFDNWNNHFISTISRFSNVIIIGHSFGGMFPLLHPELENILSGFVILNSAPSLYLEEAARVAEEKKIPILTEPLTEFGNNPNPETFARALVACLPYYFPPHSLEKGKQLLEGLPFNYHASFWWLQKVNTINFNAKWVPQNVPTLNITGSEDCIVPCTLFEKDTRFHRDNIIYRKIENAGHMPWIEAMSEVKNAFQTFIEKLSS